MDRATRERLKAEAAKLKTERPPEPKPEKPKKEKPAEAPKAEQPRQEKKPKKPTRKEVRAAMEKSRLPDGSRFNVVYDATAARWSGTLTVGGQVFESDAGGVFKLLVKLDTKYRLSLVPPEKEPEQG
jgi:hypothetical protein